MPGMQSWFRQAGTPALLLLAVFVGFGGAIGATLFHVAITLLTEVFYGDIGNDFIGGVAQMPVWWRVLVPAIGGLCVGLLFHFARVSEAEGEGVPEVVEALAVHHGTIRPIVAPVKIVAAALTLSSGGAAGREGPVIQIGSAIGSGIAQFFSMADRERSLLLACGAAAAIGGTFGAPFAGVVFTIEILKHRPSFIWTGLIVTAALLGDMLTRIFTGHEGLRFVVSAVPDFNWWPQGAVVLLVGLLAALTALLFGLVLRSSRVFFTRFVPAGAIWRPALGGLFIGVISLYLPYIHEPAAYPLMIDLLALSTFPLVFLVTLFVVKMLATGITLGSGGVGGIFAPALLLGMLLGTTVGVLLVSLGVVSLTMVPLLALVGMAAVFAGAAHAPITAALITYEMVGEATFIIPLFIGCFAATFAARALRRESIYERQ